MIFENYEDASINLFQIQNKKDNKRIEMQRYVLYVSQGKG